ncbi:MAG: polysaccharide export protein [Thiotrichaceae bacterium]|nr:polysaccharide export protein [Thiotrichaceae bacterium]
MKHSCLKTSSTILVIAFSILISGCSNSGSSKSYNSGASGSGISGGLNKLLNRNSEDASKVFSNLNELQYTPSSQGAYKISPNDLLEINVFRVAELSGKTRVDQNGRITLPLIGTLMVSGLSQEQLEKRIARNLSKNYLQNPQVSIFIQEQTSREVTVGGRVNKAGVFPLKTATTVSQAIAMAGGMTDLADSKKVVLFRPNPKGQFKAYNLNLKAIRRGQMRDPYIHGKDQIIVHESGSRLWLGRVLNVVRGFVSPVSFN